MENSPHGDLQWAFEELRDPNCSRCGLGPLNGPLRCLLGVGSPHAELMLIGEAPGRREIQPDVRRPFAGPSGKYLDLVLENVGLDRDSIFITNVLACRPPDNRDPLPDEIKACRHFLDAQILAIKPKRILALGNIALKALTGKSGITAYRGKLFTLNYDDLPPIEVFASFHPRYVRSNPRFYPILYTDLLRLKGVEPCNIKTNYIPVTDLSTFKKMARELLTSPEVSFDLETEGLDPWTGAKLICIGFSNKEGHAYVVPLEGKLSPWDVDQLKDVYRLTEAILTNPHSHIIAFNSKFDILWLLSRGVKARCDWDAMMAATLLDENLPHGLEASVQFYLNPDFRKPDTSKIATWPWEKVWPYNGADCDWTLRLSHVLVGKLAQESTSQRLFDHLIMPVQSKILPKLELGGIYVIDDNLKKAREICVAERSKYRAEIINHVPPDYVPPVKSKKARKKGFNPGSPKQLGHLLFKVLGLPMIQLTKTGDPSTSESVLLELKGKHLIIEDIMEFRKYDKYQSTYIEPWETQRDVEGFIHPHYHLVPVTGRLSSTDPNLQQTARYHLIRNCLGAPPGWGLLSSDYVQIEMRLAAHYSHDDNLLQAYYDHEDIHTLNASLILGVPKEQVTKDQRKKSKAVGFGLIFGMGAFGLMVYAKEKFEVDMTLDEATQWRIGFFRRYPRLLEWHRECIQYVHKHHYVVSFIGRVRHLNNILSPDDKERSEAERQAINSPVQGLASDLVLMSVVEIDKILPSSEGRLVGLVHDQALYMIRLEKMDYWRLKIKQIMENPPLHLFTDEKLLVPIEAEVTVSACWG